MRNHVKYTFFKFKTSTNQKLCQCTVVRNRPQITYIRLGVRSIASIIDNTVKNVITGICQVVLDSKYVICFLITVFLIFFCNFRHEPWRWLLPSPSSPSCRCRTCSFTWGSCWPNGCCTCPAWATVSCSVTATRCWSADWVRSGPGWGWPWSWPFTACARS